MNRLLECITTIILFAMIILIVIEYYYDVEHDNACNKIGFDSYVKKYSGIDYCEDSEDNLHHIKMKCNGWGLDCTAKKITVGDVEVKE